MNSKIWLLLPLVALLTACSDNSNSPNRRAAYQNPYPIYPGYMADMPPFYPGYSPFDSVYYERQQQKELDKNKKKSAEVSVTEQKEKQAPAQTAAATPSRKKVHVPSARMTSEKSNQPWAEKNR